MSRNYINEECVWDGGLVPDAGTCLSTLAECKYIHAVVREHHSVRASGIASTDPVGRRFALR